MMRIYGVMWYMRAEILAFLVANDFSQLRKGSEFNELIQLHLIRSFKAFLIALILPFFTFLHNSGLLSVGNSSNFSDIFFCSVLASFADAGEINVGV